MGRRRRTKAMSYGALAAALPKRNTSIADAIKHTVAKYYVSKMRMCFFELGLVSGGRLRADVLALAMNGYLVIVEVKSSVADFRADKKMDQYEPYCNQSYVAMPESVHRKVKEKVLPGWGVFIMTEDGSKIIKVKGAKPFEVEPEIATSLYIRAAFRSADTNAAKNK
jgi:hypothetical protein